MNRRWVGVVAAVGIGVVAAQRAMAAQAQSASRVGRTGRSVWRAEPELTDLLRTRSRRLDFVDAWAVTVLPGDSRSAADWAHAALSSDRPSWIVATLMRIRNAVVRPFGLDSVDGSTRPYTGFPLLASGDDEVVLGLDDKHLNFRVGVRVSATSCVVTTTVTLHNALGRAYWSVVQWFHPWIVRSSLRRVREVRTAEAPSVG